MSEDLLFPVNEAVLSNLERLSREESVIGEQRLLELYDIALPMVRASIELLDEGLESYEMLSVLSEGLTFGDYSVSDDTTPEYRDLVGKSLNTLSRSDKALFTELYLKGLYDLGRNMTESDFLPSSLRPETFTYVRNSFSDEAYDVFSQDFVDPTVRYSATFKECARAVSADEVTYCLLPLEEKGGVRLHTVSEIIFRNDFKINSVIPVFGPDGNADMKYALVSKNFTVPERKKDDDLYLEIRIGADGDRTLAEVFGAVDYFGMSIYRVNTVTFDTEGESETYFSVVIKDGGSFAPILTYLTLFLRDFVPVGIYKNLE
jgi:hypothetical protein